jgi:YVTN family beta-propeller protein
VAVSPDGTRVYASNYGGDTVSAINAATGLVVATINVGDAPIGVAFTPDGYRVYVANEFGSSVSVIDTDPANTGTYNTVIATIGVGSNPNAVAFTPDGFRAYVSDGGAGTVSVIDTDPTSINYNSVIATISVGGGVYMAIKPNLHFVGEAGFLYANFDADRASRSFTEAGIYMRPSLRYQMVDWLELQAGVTVTSMDDYDGRMVDVGGYFRVLPQLDVNLGMDFGDEIRSLRAGGRLRW